jgi:hypothetical protein
LKSINAAVCQILKASFYNVVGNPKEMSATLEEMLQLDLPLLRGVVQLKLPSHSQDGNFSGLGNPGSCVTRLANLAKQIIEDEKKQSITTVYVGSELFDPILVYECE